MTPGAAFWSGFFRGLSGIAQRTSARSDRRHRRRVVQRQDGVDDLVHTLFANPPMSAPELRPADPPPPVTPRSDSPVCPPPSIRRLVGAVRAPVGLAVNELVVVNAEPQSRGKGMCGGCRRYDQVLFDAAEGLRCAECKASPPAPRTFRKVEVPAKASAVRLTAQALSGTVDANLLLAGEDELRRRELDQLLAQERQRGPNITRRRSPRRCHDCGDELPGEDSRSYCHECARIRAQKYAAKRRAARG